MKKGDVTNIVKLKKELQDLKEKKKNAELTSVNNKLDRLLELLRGDYSMPSVEKLDILLDENTVLAKGLLRASRKIDEVNLRLRTLAANLESVSEGKLVDLGSSIKDIETSVEKLSGKRPVRKTRKVLPRPPIPRKEIFERYKQEFSK